MSRLVLVGLPGVGKTTVGRALAERWAIDFIDTDDVVAINAGMSAAQYLRCEGEATFRVREFEALRAALDVDAVISTGGGIVCHASSRDALAKEITLWLDCNDDVILRRLGEVDRPLLGDAPAERLAVLRREREPWYREVSLSRVDTSVALDDVLTRISGDVTRLSQ